MKIVHIIRKHSCQENKFTFTTIQFLAQGLIFYQKKIIPFTTKINLLLQEYISLYKNNTPVPKTDFLSQELTSCHYKKIPEPTVNILYNTLIIPILLVI